ncbi:LOW QUALITY PROTEIN: TEPSIN isoform 11, partial [Pongo abelii]
DRLSFLHRLLLAPSPAPTPLSCPPAPPSRAFQAGPAERKGDGHSQTLGERTGLGQHSVASDGREGAADPVDVEPLCPCCWRPGGLAARRPP